MIQQLAPLLGLNATSLSLTEVEYDQLMSRRTFVTPEPTTAPPVNLQVQDLLAEATNDDTSQEMTTLAENVRESKIFNEVITEANTALPDLGSVLSSVDILDLAIFTDYEPESQVFQRIPSLDEVVLTCDVLTASGDSAAVIGEANIRAMESRDLMNCLETLGRLPWTNSGRGAVWRALKKKLNIFSDSELRPIKREMMLQLHNLLPAVVSADPDLIDVTEDNIDGLSVIGK